MPNNMTENKELLYKADNGDGTYKNPVTWIDMSDPDAIAFGGYFYMVTSSFNYTPGLPVWRSKDLVSWELINYALKEVPDPSYREPRHACGVWAPAIRCFKGLIYVYFGMPDEGIYCVTTKDPEGVWDAPVKVFEGKGYIDPCPYFGKDGNYLVHAYAKSRYGSNSKLGVFRLSEDGLSAVSGDRLIFDGNGKDGTEPTLEGPKVYERDGKVYIFAPAGGVATGWQTVLRGDSVYGPFEARHVLEQGDTPFNGPHQGALVTDAEGHDWFLHFQATPAHGRILHLQPVKWENDWPVMGNNGRPVAAYRKPAALSSVLTSSPGVLSKSGNISTCSNYTDGSDSFSGPGLNLLWQSPANTDGSFYTLTGNALKLNAEPFGTSLFSARNVLTQAIAAPEFTVTVTLSADGLLAGEFAGIALYGSNYRGIGVQRDASGRLHFAEFHEDSVLPLAETECNKMQLVIRGDRKGDFNIFITADDSISAGAGPKLLCPTNADISKLPYNISGHQWVGARIMLFAGAAGTAADRASTGCGYAIFKDFSIHAD